MSPAAILAIGAGVAVAIVLVLLAARRAGAREPEMHYGHELDPPPRDARGRRARPGGRKRALLALVAGMLAALGAGLATGLSHGHH